MKLNAAQLERTTTQLQAEVIPDDHPLIPRLNRMFGDHTYLLDSMLPPNWRRTPPAWGSW